MKYEGIVDVRNSNGQIVTNYTIHSESGTDWTKPYVPDPSPVLTQAVATNGGLRVLGSFQARSNETYVLEFEATKECPEVRPWETIALGERTIITDAAGHADFEFLFPTNLPLPLLLRAMATDASTNTSPPSACVPIVDAQPPTIFCPPSFANPSPDTNGVVVAFVVAATDNNPSNLTVVCTPPSGSVFPVGVTTVNCTATDAGGNLTQCSFDVTVNVQPPVEWVGGSGDWSTPSNWSTGMVPGPGDNVVIDRSGDRTITHSSGDDGVLSIVCRENFTLSGGSLSVSNSARIDGTLNFSGGTLSGLGDVTIAGTLNWGSYGMMTGAGRTIIASGGTLNWFSPAGIPELRRRLDNAGTMNWHSGVGPFFFNGGTINNLVGGVVNQSRVSTQVNGGVNAINNAGTWNKVGSDNGILTVPFNNIGTVNVQDGTLSLHGGGTHGSASVLTGAGKVAFPAGTHRFSSGAQFSIQQLTLSGGTLDFGSGASCARMEFFSGALTSRGDVTATNAVVWTGGTMGGTGKTVITPGATLTMAGGTLGRELLNQGTATWDGSSWLNMLGGTINNQGAFTIVSGYCYANGGVNAFNNLPGAILTKIGGSSVQFQPNGGTLSLNNSGTVNVLGGNFFLSSLGTNNGLFDVIGGTLKVSESGAVFQNLGALRSGIDGTFELSGGNISGNTTNISQFAPKGRVLINGVGTRQLEVMSRDLGNVAAGYETNFAYGTLELGGGVNLTLVDASDSNPGTEALYIDKLIVPSGAALNLSGFNVYVRAMQVSGTVTGGAITIVPTTVKIGPDARLGQQPAIVWPATLSAWQLEYTSSLLAPQWEPVTNEPVLINEENVVPFTFDGSQKFFRLRRP